METLELFLTRAVEDRQIVDRYKLILDEWSERIPFSPIKKLGTKTEFVSAIEHATYKTKVTTQIEKRSLKDHEDPYHNEDIPAKPIPRSSFDPWKINFTPFADFSKHHRSQDLIETRRVYDCSTCRATGDVTCSDCSGAGQVRCNDCRGYGYDECSGCKGRGQIRETRTVSRQKECRTCHGKGYYSKFNSTEEERCFSCGGKGYRFEDVEEEYHVPCGECAASGKITCSDCRGSGKVTCSDCGGTGKVECSRCAGQRRLLSYTSVEVEEDFSHNESQYISPTLPTFKKTDHPLSNLQGKPVFAQDEAKAIAYFDFEGQAAAEVLAKEVALCRSKHGGQVLRQRIEIERCVVVEYRYRHNNKEYSIYLNPEHRLVEDLEGPVQSFIESADALAEKAFKEKRYEDAFRLITRGLCMDEATEPEKKLRDRVLKKLMISYRLLCLTAWCGAAIAWVLASGLPTNFQISWWFVLSLIPLFLGCQAFGEDFGLRLSRPKDRVLPAALLGLAAFLSGVVIGAGTSWTDWIACGSLALASGGLRLARSSARDKIKKLESCFKSFANPQALESYVLSFDPKDAFSNRVRVVLMVLVTLLLAQPMFKLALGINSWALDRTRIQFNVQVDGKAPETTPEVLFNGKPIHSGDKVEPGKGLLEVNDVRFMPYQHEVEVAYAHPAVAGIIGLIGAHGQVAIISDPPDAEFQLKSTSRNWSGALPFHEDIPIGDYQLLARRKGWELATNISVVRGGNTTSRIEFAYGSLSLATEPAGLRVFTNGVEVGQGPLLLQEVVPGQYTLAATDGENDLETTLVVAPKESAKHTFTFRYGAVQLESIPSGATVIRRGKEAGKTPLRLGHIPAGETQVVIKLDGYVATNFVLRVVADEVANLAAKLISERYVQAIQQARDAFAAGQFSKAQESIAIAAAAEPDDKEAKALGVEIAFRMHCQRTVELLSTNNHFAEATLELARAEELHPDSEDVAKLRQQIASKKLDRFNGLLSSAEAALSRGKADDANRDLNEAERLIANQLRVTELRAKLAPALRDTTWRDVVSGFRDSRISEAYVWKYKLGLAAARDGTIKAMGEILSGWKMEKEDQPSEKVIVLTIKPKGLRTLVGSPYIGVLMLSEIEGGGLEMRAKFWIYPRQTSYTGDENALHNVVWELSKCLTRKLGAPTNPSSLPRQTVVQPN